MVRAGTAKVAAIFLAVSLMAASAQTPDELYTSGVKARLAGQFDQAIHLFQRALALKPDNADAPVSPNWGVAALRPRALLSRRPRAGSRLCRRTVRAG